MDTDGASQEKNDLFGESLPQDPSASAAEEPTQVVADGATDDVDLDDLFGVSLLQDPPESTTQVTTEVTAQDADLDDLFGGSPTQEPSSAAEVTTQIAKEESMPDADLDDFFGESAAQEPASSATFVTTQVPSGDGADEAVLDDLFGASVAEDPTESATPVISQAPTQVARDDAELDDLFGDSVAEDAAASATQVAAQVAAEDADLDDLFGDSMAPDPSADATQITKQVPAEEADFADVDLFGDDEEASDDEAAGPQPEIGDIFGADIDDDEEDVRHAGKKKPVVKEELPRKVKEEIGAEGEDGGEGEVADNEATKAALDPEDEERDLFGELSDVESDGGREIEEHSVRKRLLPDGEVFLFKIPNTLAMSMEPYNPDTLEASLGFKERLNAYDRPAVALCGPENTIRWRFKCNERGERMRDDSGDGVFESNAQFVEWEDGSIMLQVGDEYFECQNREETRSHLYVEEENDLFVFHKPLTRQMQVVPSGFTSKTHERLLNSQINKVRSSRTVKPLSQMQAEKKSREQEAEAEEMRQQQQAKKTLPKKRPVMDADYLEGDETAEGPSLKVLKKNPALGGFLQRASETLR